MDGRSVDRPFGHSHGAAGHTSARACGKPQHCGATESLTVVDSAISCLAIMEVLTIVACARVGLDACSVDVAPPGIAARAIYG
jgi:hypothetical protein